MRNPNNMQRKWLFDLHVYRTCKVFSFVTVRLLGNIVFHSARGEVGWYQSEITSHFLGKLKRRLRWI